MIESDVGPDRGIDDFGQTRMPRRGVFRVWGGAVVTGLALAAGASITPASAQTEMVRADYGTYPLWFAPFWYPHDPGVARRAGIPTLYQEGGVLDQHDTAHQIFGYPGRAKEEYLDRTTSDLNNFPERRGWMGRCQELALAGIWEVKPSRSIDFIAGARVDFQTRVGLLVAKQVANPTPDDTFNPALIRRYLVRFLQNGRPMVAERWESGRFFRPLHGVSPDLSQVLLRDFDGEDLPVPAASIRSVRFGISLDQSLPEVPDIVDWVGRNQLQELNTDLVSYLVYGTPLG
ncbi:hypothetical protein HYW42_00070 [Candidatus Daviesbacteria bacterium]|nr:hypothetical protein [Candidatus Daviesbacteria bacterium]